MGLVKSRFAGQIMTYTLFSALQKSIPFLLLPIWTRIFTQAEMGDYIIFQSINVIVFPIVSLSMDSSLIINYFRIKKILFSYYLTNVVCLALFSSVCYVLLLLLLTLFFTEISSIPLIWIVFSICMVVPQFIYLVRLNLYRNQNQPVKYGVYALMNTFLTSLFGALFVFLGGMTWEGLILGNFIGTLFVAIGGGYSMLLEHYFKWRKCWVCIHDALKIGIPISIQAIGTWFISSIDKIILGTFIGSTAAGIYGIGGTFATIAAFLPESLYTAFIPFMFEKLRKNRKEDKEKIVIASYCLYGCIIFFIIILLFVGYYGVTFIYGEKYTTSKPLILPLVIAAAFAGFSKIHNGYLVFFKKTQYLALISICGGIFNLCLLMLFIYWGGIEGVAYATLVTQLLIYIVVLIVANKVFPMPWKFFIERLIKN